MIVYTDSKWLPSDDAEEEFPEVSEVTVAVRGLCPFLVLGSWRVNSSRGRGRWFRLMIHSMLSRLWALPAREYIIVEVRGSVRENPRAVACSVAILPSMKS